MGKRKVDPELKRKKIVEVIRDKKPLRQAAKELGLAPSTLHEAVKETEARTEKAFEPAGDQAKPAPTDPAAAAAAPAPSKEAEQKKIDDILAHARGLAAAPAGSDVTRPLSPTELRPAPALDRATFCVEKSKTLKALSIWGISHNYGIPATDPILKELTPLSPGLEIEIRANADFLFPYLEKWGGVGMLAAIALMELWNSMAVIKMHAVKNYGYKEPDPKAPRKPQHEIDAEKIRQAQEAALAEQARRQAAAAAALKPEEEEEEEEDVEPGVVKPDPFNCPNERRPR